MHRLIRKAPAFLLALTLSVSGVYLPVCATDTQAQATPTAEPTPALEADKSVVATNGIEGWPKASDIYSTTGCLLDADTGAVLYSKGMDNQMFPASTTKIMTCLLALDYGKHDNHLDDTVTVTQTGVNYAVSGSSNLNTKVGEQFKLRDMLYGMMLKSANDMATEIGEHVGGGSIDTFVQKMNDKAKSLGCTNTHFTNACGMPDDQHYTTAHDLALIGQAAVRYPLFRTIISTPSYTIPATNMTPARTVTSHTALLVDPNYKVEGIIGGKTGYTDAAMSCLVSFVERDGRTLIAVTLHAADGGHASVDHKSLYDYGYGKFKDEKVLSSAGKEAGSVTIPADANLSDCEAAKEDTTDSEGNAAVKLTYTYKGQTVGSTVMTKEEYGALEAADSGENEAASEAQGKETIYFTRPSTSESQPPLEGLDALNPAVLRQSSLGRSILVLGALIIAGLFAIVITVIVKKHRRR